MYDSFLPRSFSKKEQKKLRYGAFAVLLFILFIFATVVNLYLVPKLPILDLKTSVVRDGSKMFAVTANSVTPPKQDILKVSEKTKTELLCDGASCRNSLPENITTARNMKTEMELDYCNTTKCHDDDDDDDDDDENDDDDDDDDDDVGTIADKEVQEKNQQLCNIGPRTDFCNITGDIRIESSSSSVLVVSPQIIAVLKDENTPYKIKPYARKGDSVAMNNVREWSVTQIMSDDRIPKCTKHHSVPAVMFSTGGYAGNHFHAFTDIIVPLFITTRAFNGEVQLLITDLAPWWVNKFKAILENLSRYEVIDIDNINDTVHCFPSAIVGLMRHEELSIDPSESPYTMKDFKAFLRKSYSLKRPSTAIQLEDRAVRKVKPRLLIVSRKRTRAFTNVERITEMAKRTGFEVVVFEPDANIQRVAEIVNSCDVMMGVHGAGLTNILFLPDNAVLIQIVPSSTEWLCTTYFGVPSMGMEISYLEYKIEPKESTLVQEFPVDHVIFKDPSAFHKDNWDTFSKFYLEKQNVTLDIMRFRPTLLKALQLFHEHKS